LARRHRRRKEAAIVAKSQVPEPNDEEFSRMSGLSTRHLAYAAAYPSQLSRPGVADRDWVASMNPAEIVLGGETNDIKLILSRGLSMVGEADPMSPSV
jgi:hypothetical protein